MTAAQNAAAYLTALDARTGLADTEPLDAVYDADAGVTRELTVGDVRALVAAAEERSS